MDLDDPIALSIEPGRLHAAASSGAVVRAVARAALPWPPALSGAEVGACAVIVGELIDPSYGDALAQLLTELGAPVATAMAALDAGAHFPRSADAVVVVSVSGTERPLLDAVQVATSRGASTVVAAPLGSPISALAAERRAVLVEFDRPGDDPDGAWWTAYAACVALWRGARSLDELADDLDDAAGALGPVVAGYDNAAKQLATLDDPLLLIATDDSSLVLARLLTAELTSPGRAVRVVDARRGLASLAGLAAASGAHRDLFYDPQFDDPSEEARSWRPVLVPHAGGSEVDSVAERAAEHVGPVLSVRRPAAARSWSSMRSVLLAQMTGAYRTLAHR